MEIEPGAKFWCRGDPYRARSVYQWKDQWWVLADVLDVESLFRFPRAVLPLSSIVGAVPPATHPAPCGEEEK